MKKLWNAILDKTKKLWDWLLGFKFLYLILVFFACDLFYPQYSDIIFKLVAGALSMFLLNEFNKSIMPELNFFEKLNDNQIGLNYAIFLGAFIIGICYIIGN